MKRILDSVHGYISIPKIYMAGIVDTPQFQRLRRIEQTSCRALFPSARHDRFIHSLGVYHIGCLIATRLWQQNLKNDICRENGTYDKDKLSVIITYLLACLLHDVGHTPFSHTFEDYFKHKRNQLPQKLAAFIREDQQFFRDFENQFLDEDNQWGYAAHELISAIVAVHYYRNIIESEEHKFEDISAKGKPSLLVRMIVGCKYQDENHSLENAFIELMHGDVIDADGIDYVCRDVWASGYSTAKVDVKRLIRSIIIHKTEDGKYGLCYDAKVINEIKSVLQIKAFQNDIIFNHHILALEQYLLREALKDAAIYHNRIKVDPKMNLEDVRLDAMYQLCDLNMYIAEDGITLQSGTKIKLPMDDDFISIMKSTDPQQQTYISQWFNRQYQWCAIWKTREAFYADLSRAQRNDVGTYKRHAWIFTEYSKKCLEDNFGIKSSDILILDTLDKDKLRKINAINVMIEGQVRPYTDIYPKVEDRIQPFFMYIFIPIEFKSRIPEIRSCLFQAWEKALIQN